MNQPTPTTGDIVIHDIAAGTGILTLWLLMGGLAYLVLSAYMAQNHLEHMIRNTHQGVLLFVACFILGFIALAAAILGLLFEGPRREFLVFIGANTDPARAAAQRNTVSSS